MEEYWKKVWMDAVAGMRALLKGYMEVEDSCDGMRRALAYVMKHGCGAEKAEAIGHVGGPRDRGAQGGGRLTF